jgi:hypothetical protein
MPLIFAVHSSTCEYHTYISWAVRVKMLALIPNALKVKKKKHEYHFYSFETVRAVTT